ncbi:hypothetical protein PVAG01_02121 [Phlyctema vagabunda]|uniref:Uncharacterized protein n=1 Tax=Phlyctema vagabunda TaxID=108571 RepID=A0ABR4PPX8_9HELO
MPLKLNKDQDQGSISRTGPLTPGSSPLHSKTSDQARAAKRVSWASEIVVYEIPSDEPSAAKQAGEESPIKKRLSSSRTSTPRRHSSSPMRQSQAKSATERESSHQVAIKSRSTAKIQASSAKAPGETDPRSKTKKTSQKKYVKSQRSVPPAVPEAPITNATLQNTKAKNCSPTVSHDPNGTFCGCDGDFYGRPFEESSLAEKVESQMDAARKYIERSKSSREGHNEYETEAQKSEGHLLGTGKEVEHHKVPRNHTQTSRGTQKAKSRSREHIHRREVKALDFSDRSSLIGRDFILYDDDERYDWDAQEYWQAWR